MQTICSLVYLNAFSGVNLEVIKRCTQTHSMLAFSINDNYSVFALFHIRQIEVQTLKVV